MRPPVEWTLLGRPVGEWFFLALLAALGVSTLRAVGAEQPYSAAEWTLLALRSASGGAALGVVVATAGGLAFGIPALWLFGLTSAVAAPFATAQILHAPMTDVLESFIASAAVCAVTVWYGTRRLHAAITRRRWPALLAEHAAAADELVAAISGMTDTAWTRRPSPDAWSPAELTEHLARTYSQYAGESRGKNSLRIRLGPVRRTLIRLFVKPLLLRGREFPKARAPRALRPSGGPETPADGVALFRATGDACLRDLGILVERRPYRRLVHPYFGALPLYEAVRFASLHIRHHRRQLPSPTSPHVPSTEHA